MTGLPAVQNSSKSNLSHPEFKSDVPYMHFDHLDEIYAMVKSFLSFEQLDKTGLTGFWDRSDHSCTAVPILVVNICPLFFGKACMPKNTHLDQNGLRAMMNKTSAIYFFSILIMHANIAEIRKLANITIYGLRLANYFGFQIP